MTRPLRLLPVLALVASLPPAAQSFDASGPRRPLTLPPGVGLADPPAPLPLAEARPAARPAPVLRPFPAIRQAAAVKGMAGTIEWPVALTQAQAGQDVSITLAPASSIAVRPDTSVAEVAVNGSSVGRMRLGLPDTPKTFRLPARLLRAGANTVSVTVRQQHRVDCSASATAELLTAFDPAGSGLAVAPWRPASVADLAAAAPRTDGALVVSVVADRTLAPDLVPRVARAVQGLALLTGTLHPVVEITPDAAAASGIVLALGPQGTLARVLPEDALRRGSLAVVPAADGTAPVLVVTGETPEAIDRALAALDDLAQQAARRDGTGAGVITSIPLAPNEASRGLFGPLAGLGAEIVLPPDAFPADYGQATVKVRGTLAQDVLPSARLIVSVNGRVAATTTLARGRWGQADQATVTLPYGLLRPGRNRIDLAADLPTRADSTCDPLDRAESARYTLAPESSIELTEPATALRLPELAGVSAGGWPVPAADTLTLHVPRPDRGSLAAALTLAARLSVASGRIVASVFAIERPAHALGPVITVGPAGAIGPETLAAVGLDRARLAAGWTTVRRHGGGDPCQVDDAADPQPAPVSAAAAARPVAAEGDHDVGRWIAGLARRGADRMGLARGLSDGGTGLATAADLVLAQAPDGAIVVTARDSATLEQAAACLSRPRTWDRLAGQASGLDLASGSVTTVRPASVSLSPTDWSPGNLRRLLAGWLSMNAYAYVAISLFAAAALGAGTAGIVKRSGRSQP